MLNTSLRCSIIIDRSTNILVAVREAPYNGAAGCAALPRPVLSAQPGPDIRSAGWTAQRGPLRGQTDSMRSAMSETLTDDAVSALMPDLRAVMREAAEIAR